MHCAHKQLVKAPIEILKQIFKNFKATGKLLRKHCSKKENTKTITKKMENTEMRESEQTRAITRKEQGKTPLPLTAGQLCRYRGNPVIITRRGEIRLNKIETTTMQGGHRVRFTLQNCYAKIRELPNNNWRGDKYKISLWIVPQSRDSPLYITYTEMEHRLTALNNSKPTLITNIIHATLKRMKDDLETMFNIIQEQKCWYNALL